MSAAESAVVQISPDELDHQDSAARTTASPSLRPTVPDVSCVVNAERIRRSSLGQAGAQQPCERTDLESEACQSGETKRRVLTGQACPDLLGVRTVVRTPAFEPEMRADV